MSTIIGKAKNDGLISYARVARWSRTAIEPHAVHLSFTQHVCIGGAALELCNTLQVKGLVCGHEINPKPEQRAPARGGRQRTRSRPSRHRFRLFYTGALGPMAGTRM
jgi:hypothetical protein